MITEEIREELFRLRDIEYRDFQVRLIPSVEPDQVIGVRTPALRKYARQLAKRADAQIFLRDLPHRYFDENQLHAFMISGIKDYGKCLEEVNIFLPCVDNWATCDQLSPAVFKKHRQELIREIRNWIDSDRTYTVRFAIGMLMRHYLDENYAEEYTDMVASVRPGEYYIDMMIAWYFATALAKQYDAVLLYLVEKRLDPWTHNKTIQKAVESYRITPEQKAYLRTLKIRN
jgi:3-methyladenine DNA glycosylase AlkD